MAGTQQLLAFLATLSSENPPVPPQGLPKVEVAGGGDAVSVATLSVGQKDKRFTPSRVRLKPGEQLTIVNDDKRTHNVRIDDERMTFTSNAQEPESLDAVPIPAK